MLQAGAAFNYLLIMKKYNKHDLDEAIRLFEGYNAEFWMSVLCRIFGLEQDVAQCLLNNRFTMTQGVMDYHRSYNLTLDFAQSLARFNAAKDLDTVGMLKALYSKPNFPHLMRVLDPNELHEIHLFQRATASFIENNSTAVREQIRVQLSGAKLSQWGALSNVIVANSMIQNTSACIKKLRSALSAFEEVNKLGPIKLQRDGVQTLCLYFRNNHIFKDV